MTPFLGGVSKIPRCKKKNSRGDWKIIHQEHMVVPQNGWCIMETPIKTDDLGGFPPIFGNIHISINWFSHLCIRNLIHRGLQDLRAKWRHLWDCSFPKLQSLGPVSKKWKTIILQKPLKVLKHLFNWFLHYLVVEPTQLKNMLVNLDHFPNFRGENKKYLSCHQSPFLFAPFPTAPGTIFLGFNVPPIEAVSKLPGRQILQVPQPRFRQENSWKTGGQDGNFLWEILSRQDEMIFSNPETNRHSYSTKINGCESIYFLLGIAYFHLFFVFRECINKSKPY